jgi:hypothetical protein
MVLNLIEANEQKGYEVVDVGIATIDALRVILKNILHSECNIM